MRTTVSGRSFSRARYSRSNVSFIILGSVQFADSAFVSGRRAVALHSYRLRRMPRDRSNQMPKHSKRASFLQRSLFPICICLNFMAPIFLVSRDSPLPPSFPVSSSTLEWKRKYISHLFSFHDIPRVTKHRAYTFIHGTQNSWTLGEISWPNDQKNIF